MSLNLTRALRRLPQNLLTSKREEIPIWKTNLRASSTAGSSIASHVEARASVAGAARVEKRSDDIAHESKDETSRVTFERCVQWDAYAYA